MLSDIIKAVWKQNWRTVRKTKEKLPFLIYAACTEEIQRNDWKEKKNKFGWNEGGITKLNPQSRHTALFLHFSQFLFN